MATTALVPTPLEIASCHVHGEVGHPLSLSVRGTESPLNALEGSARAALRRPPCLVSFSGGRDSSLVLAIAVSVARREGLPLPIPVTVRVPHRPEVDESGWQETVVTHLSLEDWERLSFTDELDFVGPVATKVLRRHGILYPANTHLHWPLLERAAGGSLLTGLIGDDSIGGWWLGRLASVATRRNRPEPRDLLRAGQVFAPRPVRRAVAQRRLTTPASWLRPEARARVINAYAAETAGEPARWDRRMHWLARRRYMAMGLRSYGLLAADCGVQIVHPLGEPSFLAAMARAGGWKGWGDRTATMLQLFSHLLPSSVLERESKATFGEVFWSTHSRAFASVWESENLYDDLVDPRELKRVWQQDTPAPASAYLLQAAWLAAVTRNPE